METAVGIFDSESAARRAVQILEERGVPRETINVLVPGASRAGKRVPLDDGEAPGTGAAIGAVVGGATGLAGGWQAAAVASLVVPGAGSVLALGLAASALLGVAGGFAGAAAGHALEDRLSQGLPKDELFFYEDALRREHSVVVVVSPDDGVIERSRGALIAAGAESIDAARERWWSGIVRDLGADGPEYRRGFEAALAPGFRGLTWDEARDLLAARHGQAAASEPFRRGFENGRQYERDIARAR
jgi:hypothetical protein